MGVLNVRVGVASRPRPGEVACGDQHGVWTSGARTTIVLADGLGHGPEAELAATKAIDAARLVASDQPVDEVLRVMHVTLAGTRGAAVALIRVDAATSSMDHVGVGNVELVALAGRPVRPIASPGIVGMRVRRPMSSTHALHPNDLLVLHTDGLGGGFSLERFRAAPPQEIADALLAAHAQKHDDATCVVVRV